MNGNIDIAAFQKLIGSVSSQLEADVIMYSGPIGGDGDLQLMEVVRLKSNPNVMLILTTFGGSPDIAYRIARCLQRAYADGKFILFIQSNCKSAGTLIALGADEVVMCDGAQLGPLDVQISKPDELGEQMSGLTVSQALETLKDRAFECLESTFLNLRFRSGMQVRTKSALDVAVQFATGLFSPILGQIDPLGIGEHQRAMSIGEEYGTRLSSAKHNIKEGALSRLVREYPTHSFVIDREEASEYLFNEIRIPSENEDRLARILQPFGDQKVSENRPVVEFLSAIKQDTIKGSSDGKGKSIDGTVHQTTEQGAAAGASKPAETPTEAVKSDPVPSGIAQGNGDSDPGHSPSGASINGDGEPVTV